METESRVAVIGIVVDQTGDTEELNKVLHQYGQYIVGRMGIPYHKRNVNIISVVIDAPGDVISALSGKLGMLRGYFFEGAVFEGTGSTGMKTRWRNGRFYTRGTSTV